MLYIHTLLHIYRAGCDADIQAQLYSYMQLYAYQRLYTYMQPYALQRGAAWGMGPPLHSTDFEIYFDRGIDNYGSWLGVMKDNKVVKQAGAWYCAASTN